MAQAARNTKTLADYFRNTSGLLAGNPSKKSEKRKTQNAQKICQTSPCPQNLLCHIELADAMSNLLP
eukprot:515656-Karenia_brevis.AAC.1